MSSKIEKFVLGFVTFAAYWIPAILIVWVILIVAKVVGAL